MLRLCAGGTPAVLPTRFYDSKSGQFLAALSPSPLPGASPSPRPVAWYDLRANDMPYPPAPPPSPPSPPSPQPPPALPLAHEFAGVDANKQYYPCPNACCGATAAPPPRVLSEAACTAPNCISEDYRQLVVSYVMCPGVLTKSTGLTMGSVNTRRSIYVWNCDRCYKRDIYAVPECDVEHWREPCQSTSQRSASPYTLVNLLPGTGYRIRVAAVVKLNSGDIWMEGDESEIYWTQGMAFDDSFMPDLATPPVVPSFANRTDAGLANRTSAAAMNMSLADAPSVRAGAGAATVHTLRR